MAEINYEKASCPTIQECFQYMEDYTMYDHIRDHSKQVARTAVTLVNGLRQCGATKIPRLDLTIAGALLHDIAKTGCIEKECCHHGEVGQQICKDLGYPEISHIVIQHIILDPFLKENYEQGFFDPASIVYYSDKRVMHDQIVELDKRLAYIIKRYGKNDAKIIAGIQKNFHAAQLLEKHLFSHLNFSPESLKEFANQINLNKLELD
ncbi:MAG: HD domain-containing protein [Desulfotalea sp.]